MANPKSGEGFKANVRAGEYHLRLKVEYTPTGWVATVAERKGNTEADRKMVDTADAGKKHAEEVAKRYLANQDLKIPAITWTAIGIG
jgi:hypothetical protein